jgi:nucleoside-diphosphate-sugar epimerase
MPVRPRVLVTGATGKIGRHVTNELLARGYRVRALTSQPVSNVPASGLLEWRQLDFRETLDFDPVVRDCAAVIHLGAELHAIDRMQRSNVDATRALADASERSSVKVFCYTSTVSVYGSSRRRRVTEGSPVLTPDRDVRRQYWGGAVLRCYGRTKLGGELAIKTAARNVEYVIVRPPVVVDLEDLLSLGDRSKVWKRIGGARHAHHVYAPDVADAILWFMERGLNRHQPAPTVSTFNLSEDEAPIGTYGQLFKAAYNASGDGRWNVTPVPWPVEWLRMMVAYRRLLFRQPYGRMFFVGDKLRREGYKFRFGMSRVVEIFCGELTATADARGGTAERIPGLRQPARPGPGILSQVEPDFENNRRCVGRRRAMLSDDLTTARESA